MRCQLSHRRRGRRARRSYTVWFDVVWAFTPTRLLANSNTVSVTTYIQLPLGCVRYRPRLFTSQIKSYVRTLTRPRPAMHHMPTCRITIDTNNMKEATPVHSSPCSHHLAMLPSSPQSTAFGESTHRRFRHVGSCRVQGSRSSVSHADLGLPCPKRPCVPAEPASRLAARGGRAQAHPVSCAGPPLARGFSCHLWRRLSKAA